VVEPAQDTAALEEEPMSDNFASFDEERPAWQADAACAGMPTDDFFPVGSTGAALAQIAAAKAVCAACPVAQKCLEYALSTGQTDGIWGGMSEDERRTEHRRRRRSR
jgi:WhiB family transcriptional regulator, redox-sensing transcriptional regulator